MIPTQRRGAPEVVAKPLGTHMKNSFWQHMRCREQRKYLDPRILGTGKPLQPAKKGLDGLSVAAVPYGISDGEVLAGCLTEIGRISGRVVLLAEPRQLAGLARNQPVNAGPGTVLRLFREKPIRQFLPLSGEISILIAATLTLHAKQDGKNHAEPHRGIVCSNPCGRSAAP